MKKRNEVLSPIQKFINAESFSGILLFLATILALIISNTNLFSAYQNILNYEIGIKSEDFKIVKPIILWINDGLMAIFFFLIGLEIKREVLIGELNTIKKATLPVFAAIGGMIIPLIIYLSLNTDPETSKGWGISMATDIAFTLAILKLLGKNVPVGLKIFLTAFAIIDDIGAVLVIAIFYTGDIQWNLIMISALLLSVLYVLSFLKIHSKFLLLIFGVIIWVLFLKSGIHPTIAGVLLALAVPVRQKIDEFTFSQKLCELTDRLTLSTNTNKLPLLSKQQIEDIDNLEEWTSKVQSPVQQLEHRLHNWVAFLIMPVFALANAGINLSGGFEIDYNLVSTIAISLVVGKTLGVFGFSYLSIKTKVAGMPDGINFIQILGVAVLSGVGFTMSLFVGGLAFPENEILLGSSKIGIILASVVSGIVGFILIRIGTKRD